MKNSRKLYSESNSCLFIFLAYSLLPIHLVALQSNILCSNFPNFPINFRRREEEKKKKSTHFNFILSFEWKRDKSNNVEFTVFFLKVCMVQNYNDTEKVLRKFIMSLKLLSHTYRIWTCRTSQEIKFEIYVLFCLLCYLIDDVIDTASVAVFFSCGLWLPKWVILFDRRHTLQLALQTLCIACILSLDVLLWSKNLKLSHQIIWRWKTDFSMKFFMHRS